MKADNAVLAAMSHLVNDKNFSLILGYLDKCAAEQTRYCKTEKDVVLLHRAQGAAVEIETFVDLCRNSRSILEERKASHLDMQKESII